MNNKTTRRFAHGYASNKKPQNGDIIGHSFNSKIGMIDPIIQTHCEPKEGQTNV